MNYSEKKVSEYFLKKGFEVICFTKNEMMKIGKTPDFKVLKDGDLFLYCEVKEINKDNRLFKDGLEKDNTYNIISDCISESYKQFVSVNPYHDIPNVIAIYSRRIGINILDFKITVEGGFHTEEGKFLPWLKNVSEGRIKDRKVIIDMCIWYDEDKDDFKITKNSNSAYYEELESYF